MFEFFATINPNDLVELTYVLILGFLAVFYRMKNKAVYYAALLVFIQYAIDLMFLNKFRTSLFGYHYCYIVWSSTAFFVVVALFIKYIIGKLKISIVEYLLVGFELFIVALMITRHTDKFFISKVDISGVYATLAQIAYLSILLTLLLPLFYYLLSKFKVNIAITIRDKISAILEFNNLELKDRKIK